MNREIKIPKMPGQEFRILVFCIKGLFLIAWWKINRSIPAILAWVGNWKKRSSIQNLNPSPNGESEFLSLNQRQFGIAISCLIIFNYYQHIKEFSPGCFLIYISWNKNLKFWIPTDPNRKTISHQAYLWFGTSIAVLYSSLKHCWASQKPFGQYDHDEC